LWTHHQELRRAQGEARSRSVSSRAAIAEFVVGREIPARAASADRQPADLGGPMPAPRPRSAGNIDLAARGAAVLVMSQDLDELFEISDRIGGDLCRAAVRAAADAPRRPPQIGMLMAASA